MNAQPKQKAKPKNTEEFKREEKTQVDRGPDAAAGDASAKSRQANDQAKAKAKAAAAAVESKENWNVALREATDAFNSEKAAVAERIREMNKNLAEEERTMKDAEAAERAVEQKAAEKRIEYEAAQATENVGVEALAEALGKVKAANKVSSDNAADAKVVGREAEADQNALDDAVTRR